MAPNFIHWSFKYNNYLNILLCHYFCCEFLPKAHCNVTVLFSSLDQVMEKAMHKCVLKPLKSVIEDALKDFQVSSGTWQQLKENLVLAKIKEPQEMGVEGAFPPDSVAIEKIRHKFQNMCKMYSPEKKVSLLLIVCKLIYTIMENNSGM